MALSSTRKRLITVGLFAGAVVGSAGLASALTSTTTPSTPPANTVAADPAAGTGVDHSNNDPTHEAGESAQREADETAGKMGHGDGDHSGGPGGHHHSNTDAAHEAGESPERAAQEAADDAKIGAQVDAGTTVTTTP